MNPIHCELCDVLIPRTHNNQKYCKHCYKILNNVLGCVNQRQKSLINKSDCKLCGKKLKTWEKKYCNKCRKKGNNITRTRYIKSEHYKKLRKKHDIKYKQSQHGKENNKHYNRLRRNNLYKIIEHYSMSEWTEKLNKTEGICPFCGENVGIENLQLDHIYPISKAEEGRVYTIDDVQPLCGKCNREKGNKIIS